MSQEGAEIPAAAPAEEVGGRLYWFYRNSLTRGGAFLRRHRKRALIGALVALALLLFFRPYVHPAVLLLRRSLFVPLLLLPLIASVLWGVRAARGRRRLAVVLLGALPLLICCIWIRSIQSYLALYLAYRSLPVRELSQLPLSDYERIHPLNSIFSLAHEAMSETEAPTLPEFVRVGDQFRWTMAIEPAYPISRAFGSIEHIYSVDAASPAPSFSSSNKIPVQFPVGKNLLFSHNAFTSTIRAFGLARFLSYEPANVGYIPDDKGEWVQVVPLIRWRGILFARPEFGGVQLIRQEEPSFAGTLRRMLFGIGEWVPPAEIDKHRFLRGQNIVPLTVSRYMAHSFRFHNGFLAPLPGYHLGDIRIPDLAADENKQPFTGYFVLPGEEQGKLYHYFGLEPFDPDKQGLNISLFVPADGKKQVYAFKHHQYGGSLTGVSAIAAKVMESRKEYDWSRNRPVEHRPFIKQVGGKIRFFWLTTVVTLKEGHDSSQRHFISGSVPDVVLTDAAYNRPVWVNPMEPQTWISQVESVMSGVWGQS